MNPSALYHSIRLISHFSLISRVTPSHHPPPPPPPSFSPSSATFRPPESAPGGIGKLRRSPPSSLLDSLSLSVDLISRSIVIRSPRKETELEKMQKPSEEQSLKVRKLEISDKGKGFIELLQQLSVCDSVSDKEFEDRFRELGSIGDDHVICVIEDELSGRIIATGSVFIEKKFLRNCGKVGHIEDVVVDSNARGKQLGKKVVEFLIDHARSIGCYKVILDCSLENKVFYEKCGFKQKEVQMVKYFI